MSDPRQLADQDMCTHPELMRRSGWGYVFGDQVIRLVGLWHAAKRVQMLAREPRPEVTEDVGSHLPAHVRTNCHRSADLEERRQVFSLKRVEQRGLVVTRKEGRAAGPRVCKEFVHDLRGLWTLVDVVAEKHHVRSAACSEGVTKPPDGAQVPMNVAHERNLGTHSRIFSTSASREPFSLGGNSPMSLRSHDRQFSKSATVTSPCCREAKRRARFASSCRMASSRTEKQG